MLIDEILVELARGRKSIEEQAGIISEIAEKSNNVLLQLETQSLKRLPTQATSTQPNATPYNYNKATLQALTQIVEQFKYLLNADRDNASADDVAEDTPDLEQFLNSNRQRSEFLCSNVRKLLSLSDTVAQMKADMLLQDEECHITLDEINE